MILSRRFALRPTPTQATALGRAAGASRWAYNWSIARQREALNCKEKLPTAVDLHKKLNKLKLDRDFNASLNIERRRQLVGGQKTRGKLVQDLRLSGRRQPAMIRESKAS